MQGAVHKKNEIVQDVTLHDLDSLVILTFGWCFPVQGDVHKEKEIVQDVTLHDLDSLAFSWLFRCRVMCTRRRRLCKKRRCLTWTHWSSSHSAGFSFAG